MLLLMAALCALLQWWTPLYFDDWGFMSYWNDISDDGSFSFSTWHRYYTQIRIDDNGRIANALAPFSTLWSPWKEIFPILTGCWLAVIAALLLRVVCFGNERLPYRAKFSVLAFLWALMLLLLPWQDFLFTRDFSLNYIWAAGITLVFIYLLVGSVADGRSDARGVRGPLLTALLVVLAVIAGGWHESFALPTAAGLILYAVCRKGRLPWRFYLILTVYIISALAFALSPGIIRRFGEKVGEEWNAVIYFRFMHNLFALALLLGVVILFSLLKRGRRALFQTVRNPYIMVGLGVLFVGSAIAWMPNQPPRAFFYPNLFAITVLVCLALNFLRGISMRPFRIVVDCISVVLACLCVAQGIAAIWWQRIITVEYDELAGRLLNGEGPLFYDVFNYHEVPLYTLKFPVKNTWGNEINYRYLWTYRPMDFISVVPAALEYADYDHGEPVGGNLNARVVDGLLVAPYRVREVEPDLVIPVVVRLKARLKSGEVKEILPLESPFVTKPFVHSDGTERADTLMYYDLTTVNAEEIESISI